MKSVCKEIHFNPFQVNVVFHVETSQNTAVVWNGLKNQHSYAVSMLENKHWDIDSYL